MDYDEQIRITKRLLAHIAAGTAESASQQLRVPVSDYTDPALWSREIETFYKRLPIVAGLSCELPAPGAYKAMKIVGVPVLLTRDNGGELHAFLNVCRHRGSNVAEEGCGRATRFSCPYHGWTYDNRGRLVGVSNERNFGVVDRVERSLTPLPAAERAGIIFVGLTPEMDFDIDGWLAGTDKHMAPLGAKKFYYTGERSVPAGNWKLVVEGHLEAYHFATLHRNSISDFMLDNCATIDRFGPHILITFANKSILSLRDKPESEWHPIRDNHINPQYMLFPSTSIVLFGDAMQAQIILPGPSVGQSTNRLVLSHVRPVENDLEHAAAEAARLDFNAALVRDEDYSVSFRIQDGLSSGAQSDIIFGKNEPGLTYFHENLGSLLAASSTETVTRTGLHT